MLSDSRFLTVLSDGASRYGLTLSAESLTSFEKYVHLLSQWNTRTNLVSARDMDRFVEYHLLDALKVASVFDFSRVKTLLDFGSGAGLPGIPLSLAFPEIQVTLLDSREKRVRFLEEAVRFIPLPRATVIRSRIEDLPSSFDSAFEVVVTRATVSLSGFYRLASRLVSPGGSLLSIKSDRLEEEFPEAEKAVNTHLFHIRRVTPVSVPGVRTGQVVIITRKPVINNNSFHESAL